MFLEALDCCYWAEIVLLNEEWEATPVPEYISSGLPMPVLLDEEHPESPWDVRRVPPRELR
jgi:hypothetical protein